MSGPVSGHMGGHTYKNWAGIADGSPQTRSARTSDYSSNAVQNGTDGGAQSNKPFGSTFTTAANGWGGPSIWGNNVPLTAGFGAASRDRSATRENTTFFSDGEAAQIEGKTGSRALLDSSETDKQWSGRKLWTDHSSINATRRSSGVSPARQRAVQKHNSNINDSQSPNLLNHTHTRLGGYGHDAFRSVSLQLDTLDHFTNNDGEPDHGDEVDRAFAYTTQRSKSMWPGYADSSAVHSPAEDRRSATNSEYFGSSSATASRNGSLPPSRHGGEPPAYSQAIDAFPRLVPSQGTPTRAAQASTLSSQPLRSNQIRTNSFPNDTAALLDRLSLTGNLANSRTSNHRSSESNASVSAYSSQASNDRVQFGRSGFRGEEDTSFDPNTAPTQLHHAPDGHQMNQLAGLYGGPAAPRYDAGAMTPNSSGVRSSPYYSAAATPPLPNGSHISQNANHARNVSNPAYLDQRLRNIAQQEQHNYLNPQYSMYAPPRYPGAFGQYPYQMPSANLYTGIAGPMPMTNLNLMPADGTRARRDPDAGFGLRSTVLEEFKSNNKGRRWTLKDIMDHIVEFAGDQYGSRFIQSKLETANSDEKEAVYRKLQDNALQLMQDVFGNYVIQKFFEHGDQVQKELLAKRMTRKVFDLSKQMYGCRVVQKALEYVLVDQQAALVKELEPQGLVMILVKDQNGNHVIQKAIECVPAEHIQFIYNTFRGQIGGLAQHTYGCRVIQRMLENCTGPERAWMMEELRACAANLITDQYGNYVTQHIIEHGELEHRNFVIGLVISNLVRNSSHKFASNVVEKCLMFGTSEQKQNIMQTLLERPAVAGSRDTTLQSLINDQYGNYVIQKMQDHLDRLDYETLCEALQMEILKAKRAGRGGKQIQAIEKRMHRFDNSPAEQATNPGANPVPPRADPTQASGAASPPPPPPLLTDAQSLRSDSIPSTTVSAGEERNPGTILGLDKLRGVETPQVAITDAIE